MKPSLENTLADVLLEAAELIESGQNSACCPALYNASEPSEVEHGQLYLYVRGLLFATYSPHDPDTSRFIWATSPTKDRGARILALLLLREQVLSGDDVFAPSRNAAVRRRFAGGWDSFYQRLRDLFGLDD
jgi:hypothetical protein